MSEAVHISDFKLKVCPFCGHYPEVERIVRDGVKLCAFEIKCLNHECPTRPSTGQLWTMLTDVERRWNQRKRKP